MQELQKIEAGLANEEATLQAQTQKEQEEEKLIRRESTKAMREEYFKNRGTIRSPTSQTSTTPF